jgi:transcriptional regulator with XRE-family HTH domain
MNSVVAEIIKKQKHCMRLSEDAARVIFYSEFSKTAVKRAAELDKKYKCGSSSPVGPIRIRLEEDPERIIAWSVAQRVREARERQGLRQEDLAAKAGIARPNIARLEKGAHMPTLSTLQKVASALSIDMTVLTATPAATVEDMQRFKEMAEAGTDEWKKILDDEDSRK